MSGVEKRLLVTGGAGFIGQHLARALLARGVQPRLLDNFSPQIHETDRVPDDIGAACEVIRADVRDREQMARALDGIECVVHLAAETGTGQSMYEIAKYFDVNVQATALLLDVLQNDPRAGRVTNLVVASSRAIYGEGAYRCPEHGLVYPPQRDPGAMAAGRFEPSCPRCAGPVLAVPTPEHAELQPNSMYGITKQVQEQSVLLFARTRGISGFGLRYQNVYGPGQSLKNPYTGILAVFSNLARQGAPIEIYEDGAESRDFVFVEDVVEATLRAIFHPTPFVGALNVGTGHGVAVTDVADEIIEYFGSASVKRVTGAFRKGDIRHGMADVALLQKTLGYVPTTTFRDGLRAFLGWASGQPAHDRAAYARSVAELTSHGLMGASRAP